MTGKDIRSDDLRRLSRLLCIDVAALEVVPLSGGLTNRSFRFDYGAKSWAVRLPFESQQHRAQALDAPAEERVLRAVAQARLTPKMILYDSVTGALVTEYLADAVPWTVERAGQPGNIRRIAATLRSLHAVELTPELNPFRPSELSELYVESARRPVGRSRVLSGEEQSWQRELRRLALRYEKSFQPTSLCHHDLVAANILDDEQLWLVDFEYALRAHPILDLASLAGLNAYDSSQCNLLVEAYFESEPVPFRSEQLHEVIRLERLLSYFWARTQRGDSDESGQMRRFADAMAAMLR